MFKVSVVAALLAQAGYTLAHGGVTSIAIGSAKYAGWQPYNSPTGQVTAERPYSSFDPILSPTGATLHCNNNGQSGPSQQTLTIAGVLLLTLEVIKT
ncbi:hypothetical protein FRC12_003030 [Ceratobasidium sp. 428]|nr:hypothetical protein FRC12_003030 [Ceratobasidium sp. 428]